MIIYEQDGRKTTAIIKDAKNDARNRIKNLCGLYFVDHSYDMKDEYRATVGCYVGDEYDEQKGKDLASAEVRRQYHRDMDRIVNRFLYEFDRTAHRVEKMRAKEAKRFVDKVEEIVG